jgi:hypothetical protein
MASKFESDRRPYVGHVVRLADEGFDLHSSAIRFFIDFAIDGADVAEIAKATKLAENISGR